MALLRNITKKRCARDPLSRPRPRRPCRADAVGWHADLPRDIMDGCSMKIDMPPQFEAKFIPEPNSGCWLWTACINSRGYGQIRVNGKGILAHRLSYELHCGEIPNGKLVCHRCDCRICVNPDHLFIGTAKDNTQDMIAKGRDYKQAKKLEPYQAELVCRSSMRGIDLAKIFGISPATVVKIRGARR
jgi:hypothetical protein